MPDDPLRRGVGHDQGDDRRRDQNDAARGFLT